jgi:hypothetical protein
LHALAETLSISAFQWVVKNKPDWFVGFISGVVVERIDTHFNYRKPPLFHDFHDYPKNAGTNIGKFSCQKQQRTSLHDKDTKTLPNPQVMVLLMRSYFDESHLCYVKLANPALVSTFHVVKFND